MPAPTQLAQALHDPGLCRQLVHDIEAHLDGRQMRFMEVCGTHTVSIFQSGVRSLLPKSVEHISGPGCPVCVTSASDVELFLEAARKPGITIATFGDLLRVPGADGNSLKSARAAGARVEVVYSPLDAVAMAAQNPDREIVFLGIGFETTAPGVAASIVAARAQGLANYSVLSLHKLVPPALRTVLDSPDCQLDAFLLPGHVVTVTGLEPFDFLAASYHKAACAGGFEAGDILLALDNLACQVGSGKSVVANEYRRAAPDGGNPRARAVMNSVFEPVDAIWRGLGSIRGSGLGIREEYATFNAEKKLGLERRDVPEPSGCRCGDILRGVAAPHECPLFGKRCTPLKPVGPCMVSTEGSCAAHYRYRD